MRPIDEAIAKLRSMGKSCHGGPDRYNCQCPAHDDGSPSMLVAVSPKRGVYFHCMAGCDYRDILAAIGVRQSWDPQAEPRGHEERPVRSDLSALMAACIEPPAEMLSLMAARVRSRPERLRQVIRSMRVGVADRRVQARMFRRERTGRHEYLWAFGHTDARGRLVGISLRLPSGKKITVPGGSRGLFSGPEYGGTVFCPEGETDTLALACAGLTAVGRPGCSARIDWLGVRVAGRHAIVIGENDARYDKIKKKVWSPGIEGAKKTASSIGCRWVLPEPGSKDVCDWARSMPGLDLDNQDSLGLAMELMSMETL